MSLEKVLKYSKLFDLYGSLLTKKQQQVFSCYYFDDISLSEIADINNITKQAVKDCLDKCNKILDNYENSLKLESKLEKQNELLEKSRVEKKIIQDIKSIWEEK